MTRVPRKVWRKSRQSTLLFLLFMTSIAGTCHLPVSPGCDGGQTRVDPTQRLLTLGIMRNNPDSAVVDLDRRGQSTFSAAYTEWMLSPARYCHEISQEDVNEITQIWRGQAQGARSRSELVEEARPFIWVKVHQDGQERDFVLHIADLGHEEEMTKAVKATLRVFLEAYGERLEKELRGAGFEELLALPAE